MTSVQSYSLLDAKGEPIDFKLRQFLDYDGGSFVEVGANDGLSQSNTAMLERHFGWSGVLIEPSPAAFRQCVANRTSPTYNCALVDFSFDGSSVEGDFEGGSLMASVGGTRTATHEGLASVPARTLASVLEEAGVSRVNFFSLDTEGYELNVLKGCDFDRVVFDYLLIELYRKDYGATVEFLREKGYDLLGNFSNYNTRDNPQWDGAHNDYLFARRGLPERAIEGLGPAKRPPGKRGRLARLLGQRKS